MSDMRYGRLGRTGLVVSRIGLGMMSIGDTGRRTWHLTAKQAEPLVRHAVEDGITLFDTADMYDRGAGEEATGTLRSTVRCAGSASTTSTSTRSTGTTR